MFVQIPDAMKKLSVYAALSLLPFVAAGERTEYELEYSPFGEEVLAGEVWDVSRLAVEDSRSKAFAGIGASGIYGERLGVRELLYLFRGDSLLFRGYTAGRIEGLLNDSLTVAARFPLCGGAVGAGGVSLRGRRGDVAVSAVGTLRSEVCGTGRLVRAVADTVAGVTLVREVQSLYERFPAGAEESQTYTVTIHRWYADGSRVPLAVQTEYDGDGMRHFGRLYLSSAPVESVAGEADAAAGARAYLAGASLKVRDGVLELVVGNSSVCEPFMIEASLVDVAGHCYEKAEALAGSGSVTIDISVASLPRGSYMLVVTARDYPGLAAKYMLAL